MSAGEKMEPGRGHRAGGGFGGGRGCSSCFPPAECLLLLLLRSAPCAWRSSSPRTSWGSAPVNMPSTESKRQLRGVGGSPCAPRLGFLPAPVPGKERNGRKSPLANELEHWEQQRSRGDLAKPPPSLYVRTSYSPECIWTSVCVCIYTYIYMIDRYL